ncbi:hypothetical protein ACFX1Z_024143 [Malus domestica]
MYERSIVANLIEDLTGQLIPLQVYVFQVPQVSDGWQNLSTEVQIRQIQGGHREADIVPENPMPRIEIIVMGIVPVEQHVSDVAERRLN